VAYILSILKEVRGWFELQIEMMLLAYIFSVKIQIEQI
jgi:hypothetical protein